MIYAVDDYLGTLKMQLSFVDDDLTVFMTKGAEAFFDDYRGYFSRSRKKGIIDRKGAMNMKKYVVVGTGHRGILSYIQPMLEEYQDCVQVAAVCDINGKRARFVSEYLGREIPGLHGF